jgi:Pilin (bacterial filament)
MIMNDQGSNSANTRSTCRFNKRPALSALLLAVACASAPAWAATSSSADEQARGFAIGKALAAAADVQARVVDYSRRNNKLPSSNGDLAIADPGVWTSADVKSVAVLDGGVVQVTLTSSSGVDDGTIVLTPTMPKNDATATIEWHCASPSYNTISDITHGSCEYSKLP